MTRWGDRVRKVRPESRDLCLLRRARFAVQRAQFFDLADIRRVAFTVQRWRSRRPELRGAIDQERSDARPAWQIRWPEMRRSAPPLAGFGPHEVRHRGVRKVVPSLGEHGPPDT